MSILAAAPRKAGRRSHPRTDLPRLRFADRPREPRDFGIALLVAVALHFLVLVLLLLLDQRDMSTVRSVLDARALAFEDSLEIVYLIPLGPGSSAPVATGQPLTGLAADNAPAPIFAPRVIPGFIPAATPGPAPAQGPTGAAPPGGTVAEGGSAADRLRQRVTDPRLWGAPAIGSPLPRTQVDIVRERVAESIRALNDSIAGEDAARKRASDWTVKGEDGKRWGISPQGIHLGGITLPAPSFTPAMGSDAAKRASKDGEIAAQADRARIRDTFKDRAKAIRERKEKERAAARGE